MGNSFTNGGYSIAMFDYRRVIRTPQIHSKEGFAPKGFEVNSQGGYFLQVLHPGRLTWNLPITHLERKMIFQTSMIMVHVNLPGCYMIDAPMTGRQPSSSKPSTCQAVARCSAAWVGETWGCSKGTTNWQEVFSIMNPGKYLSWT